MTEPAGTPEATSATPQGATPETGKDDSTQVTVSAQFKEEALKWKGKAEGYNKLSEELAAERAKTDQLTRLAYGGQAATDPRATRLAQLQEQAQYDPAAAEIIDLRRDALLGQAENWLLREMSSAEVPKSKQNAVAALVRARNYSVSIQDALNEVTDPETKSLAEQLAESKKELDRLRNSKPNGASPAATVSANTDSGEGRTEPIKLSEYSAILNNAKREGASDEEVAAARALMQAVGSNKRKLERD